MMLHTLQVPVVHHLRCPSPPGEKSRQPGGLDSSATAIDSRARARRPGRQVFVDLKPCRGRPQRPQHKPNPDGAPLQIPMPLTMTTVCCVRPMMATDLPSVADLMAEEGWNVDFDNMAAVFKLQPLAYFLAQTMTGRVVGHASCIRLDEEVGMLSYILVSSGYQRRGLGSMLMQVAKESLEGRTMAFYSVQDAVPFYRARGFHCRRFRVLVRDFALNDRDFAHIPDTDNDDDDDDSVDSGIGNSSDDDREESEGDEEEDEEEETENRSHWDTVRGKLGLISGDGVVVVPARDVDFSSLLAYDLAAHGSSREAYLRFWLLRPQNVTMVALDTETGDVVGYASLSLFAGRWDVSPLYADSDQVAMCLLKRAATEIGQGIRVYARIPADSIRGITLFNRLSGIAHHRILYLMSDRKLRQGSTSSDKVYSLSTVCYGLK